MIQAAIEALLKGTIGLDADLIRSEAIAAAVRQRMAVSGCDDVGTYLLQLQSSKRELEDLTEEFLVPETWFFRDEVPFEFLKRHAISEWLLTRQHRPVRILSMPCSSGEEPYSIAMSLMDVGLATENIHIDAVDISRAALLKARAAEYSENSFRSKDLSFRARYFEPAGCLYKLFPQVCSMVHFVHANISEDAFLAQEDPYDAIFCRNLLIYFDNPARERTVRSMSRLLVEGGLLFLGAAETGQIPRDQFVPVHQPRTFAYRKMASPDQATKIERSPTIKAPQTRRQRQKTRPPAPLFAARIAPPPPAPANAVKAPLERAEQLANQGRLDEAAALCESYLEENKVSAQAYFLLGLVRQAAKETKRAEECFDRAIYLEPTHREALIHLALIAERRGDPAAAERLRERAQKVLPLDDENTL
jgi:chemotaxis protein methyltransferase WspC